MSQIAEIKAWLERGNSITSMQAITQFGCTRLAAKIHILRTKYNMNIVTLRREIENRYGETVVFAEYRLVKEK